MLPSHKGLIRDLSAKNHPQQPKPGKRKRTKSWSIQSVRVPTKSSWRLRLKQEFDAIQLDRIKLRINSRA